LLTLIVIPPSGQVESGDVAPLAKTNTGFIGKGFTVKVWLVEHPAPLVYVTVVVPVANAEITPLDEFVNVAIVPFDEVQEYPVTPYCPTP
jgi:hypothetical protein